MPPIATIVTPLPPVMVVKNPFATMHTIARPAGHPPEQRARGAHEAVGRARLGHQVAGEREQRDRDEDRRAEEALLVEHVRREVHDVPPRLVVLREPADERDAAHDGEQRHRHQREEG
jgi:hypothetical protein